MIGELNVGVIALPAQILRLTTYTKEERHSAINQVRETLAFSGAIILDFKMFSNRSINFVFEIPWSSVKRLHDCLNDLGLIVYDEGNVMSNIIANLPAEITPDSDKDIPGTLQMSFIHNDPDLRIVVPPFDL